MAFSARVHLPFRSKPRAIALLVASTAGLSLSGAALAAPLSADGKKGIASAKKGDCVTAVPLLEKSEEKEHRPATAFALAGCRVVLGDLILGRDGYQSISTEKPAKNWAPEDYKANHDAQKKAKDLDARIPTVVFDVDPPISGLRVVLADKEVTDLESPVPVSPEERLSLVAIAPGYERFTDTVVFHEGEKRHYSLALRKAVTKKPGAPVDPTLGGENWVGARFRGYLIPRWAMNIFADGGTTVFEPGFGATFTKRIGHLEIVPALNYTYYGMPLTPFKGHDTPATEWELDQANLHSVSATVDILYGFPIDKGGLVTFKIGGGIGFGVMVAGDLNRWQSYPASGKPGDPATYKKCVGPDNPVGTYRYCNSLDKDVNRYGANDSTWGNGGLRPVIYPWVALPEIGFTFHPLSWLNIDIEAAPSISGLLTGAGVRFAL